MDFHRRTWAEINLSALKNNIEEIRRAAPEKEIIAVVKANAYGHGDGIICSQLAKTGVKYFAVSCIDEALHIKDYVRGGEILIFGFMEPEDFKTAAVNNFILTVGSLEYANLLNNFICSQNMKIRVHVKINTGMNRVGIDTYAELEKILSLPGLICGGVYTHFASADSVLEDDVSFTRGQQEKLLSLVRNRGLKTHSQNSGGVLFHPGFEADFVRAGLLLYGLSPNISVPSPMKLSPVMTLKSVIQQIRILEDGAPVSYGRTYTAPGRRIAAVVPAGYADGYSRLHSNSGFMAVRGTLCPVLGRVCMDQTVIDVTYAEGVSVGDEVLIYSAKHKETSIEYIAEKLGTIPYEVICAVSPRVRRVPV